MSVLMIRILSLSGAAFVAGTLLVALQSVWSTKKTRAMPMWVNILFLSGTMLMVVGMTWNELDAPRTPLIRPGWVIAGIGLGCLAVASLSMARVFAHSDEPEPKEAKG